jgi:spore germination protein YaaH
MCEAHRHGARAITLLPLTPGGSGIDITNSDSRRQWVHDSITHLSHYGGGGWDGANLDVEGFDDAAKRDGLTAIVCELRAAMSTWLPGSQLSFDSSMDPASDNQYYDYKSLSKCVDFFVPMAYDLMGGQPAPNSPLPAVESGLRNYAKLDIPMASIVLALPFYGYSVPCAPHGDPKDCVLGSLWSSSVFQKPYGVIIEDIMPNASTRPMWNKSASSPYFDYNDHLPRNQVGAARPHPHGYTEYGTSIFACCKCWTRGRVLS